ncbi:uncharacterized protein [Prorops nasuta]|uniref:uncharacterized protein n=1 Tax=Prorops nasuta TaxID=863751 RepID=UPI0034CE597B
MGENLIRSGAYNKDEKIMFLEIVIKYKSIIENKETDKVGWKEKSKTWDLITKEFNESDIVIGNRPKTSLQKLWKNLKCSTRKYCSKLKSETYATGGGINTIRPDILFEKVHEIIGSSINGLQNPVDSDAQGLRVVNINTLTNENVENLYSSDDNHYDPDDPDDPVFQHLIAEEEIHTWSTWNPTKLRDPLSNPLRNVINGGSSDNPKSSKPKTINDLQLTLIKSKIELTNLMKEQMTKKWQLKNEILNMQLEKEKLQVQRLQSELQKF